MYLMITKRNLRGYLKKKLINIENIYLTTEYFITTTRITLEYLFEETICSHLYLKLTVTVNTNPIKACLGLINLL